MRVQMGQQSSADGAQRISFVAGAIVFEAIEIELERLLADEASVPVALWSTPRSIVAHRRECTGSQDTGLWFLDVMQDDLGYAALTSHFGDIIRTRFRRLWHSTVSECRWINAQRTRL